MARHAKTTANEREPKVGGPQKQRVHEADSPGLRPGVQNDLPEVAPHDWIYIMS